VTTSSPVTGKFSAAKTALILLFLLVVWLVFVVMPSRKEAIKKSLFAESALTLKLRAVGLPDNSDLGGLPEIFAIWADKAEWKDDKTKFAYWHPVMKTYSYYFEATRVGGRITFVEIPEPQEPILGQDESLGEDCPIRFYHSLKIITFPIPDPPPAMYTSDRVSRQLPIVKAQVEAPKIQVPKSDFYPGNGTPKP